ncbi:MAG: DUF899 domain-containing protein [Granulosicoccus sp.]|nr:DUF899 domain-containing protein [Granulosicoccus sp.]
MNAPEIVSRDVWLEKRRALLDAEKAFTRQRDDLSKLRRELPWVAVEKNYRFFDVNGEHSMLELFGDHQQLMFYHFMFGADWDAGCDSCSFWADNFEGIDIHLAQRDIAFMAVSSAPVEKLEEYRKRLGWRFRWLSTGQGDFNRDYQVSFGESAKAAGEIDYNYRKQSFYMDELPGVSVFIRDSENQIFHTYSTYARGVDILNGAYNFIDLTPLGRHEDNGQSWVKRHDEY